MVNFPNWVTAPKRQSKQQLAVKRLRYLCLRATIEDAPGGNIASFSEAIGMERTTIHLYVKLGKFSAPAAQRAEDHFGTDLISAEWLIDPLSIDA